MDLFKPYLEAYRNTIFFILFIITSIIFFYTFLEHIKSDSRLNYKYSYYVIPISISNTVGDHYAYTQYGNIRNNIKNESHKFEKNELNKLIDLSFSQQPTGPHAATLPGAEDIGLADFVTYSFFIFGNDKDSILKFYLFILFASILLFYFNFDDKRQFYLITIPFLSILILFNENFELSTHHDLLKYDRFTDSRNFSILVLISYIHICIYFFFNQKNNFKNISLLTIQIVIFNFLIFCRTSLLLEILILNFIFIFFILYKFLKSQKTFIEFILYKDNKIKINIILILLFCSFIMPNLSKLFISKTAYNEFYVERHPTVLMLRAGLMFDNPNLKNKYNYEFNDEQSKGPLQMNIDVSNNNSGKKFYDEIYNKDKDKKQIFFPGRGVNLVEQTKLEKNFILYLLKNDSYELLKNLIYYKPIKIIKGFKYEMSYKTEINPLKMIIFFVILIFLIFLNLSLSKSIFIFFLVVLPVTIKNFLFWGLTKFYFLDLDVL